MKCAFDAIAVDEGASKMNFLLFVSSICTITLPPKSTIFDFNFDALSSPNTFTIVFP